MDSAENGFVDARETVHERVGGWAVRRRIAQAGPTLLLVVGALLLPNALAILASLWIGIPARSAPIAAYVVVILVGIRLPPLAVVPLYLTVVAFDLLMIVTEIFSSTSDPSITTSMP
ncbi:MULTISPECIES: hypothetical protein [unclassified Methylobacterium]|uniref:hypothetical protein n=1 Tax=unclassified Methylobacterium TaxID=2615210 RepID=UPI001650937A|nr:MULTISPECIES: hypothetical protein [unclassified Methylobacterium]